MQAGSFLYGLWTRSGFDDFIAQTFDRHPERLSTSVIFVSDQYFLGHRSHIGRLKSTRDASQQKSHSLGIFLPGFTILTCSCNETSSNITSSRKVKSSAQRLSLPSKFDSKVCRVEN